MDLEFELVILLLCRLKLPIPSNTWGDGAMVTRLIPVLEIPEDWEFDSLSPHTFFFMDLQNYFNSPT